MSNCKKCDNILSNPKDVIQCSQCKDFFHVSCTNINNEDNLKKLRSRKATWKCENCDNRKSESVSDDFEEAGSGVLQTLIQNVSAILLKMNTLDDIENKVNKIAVIEQKLDKIDIIEQSVQFCSDKLDDFGKAMTTLSNDVLSIKKENECLKIKNKEIELKLNDYELKLNEMKQESLQSNLEITGIDETKNESVANILDAIANTLGLKYNLTDIINAYRLPKGNKKLSTIRVCFTNKNLRDTWLQQYKVKKDLKSTDINKSLKNNRIYFNEHLTPINKKLLYETKQLSKSKNYKYIWISDGKVFIRKEDNTKSIKIRSLDDLKLI